MLKLINKNWWIIVILFVLGIKYGTAQTNDFTQSYSSPAKDYKEQVQELKAAWKEYEELTTETYKVQRYLINGAHFYGMGSKLTITSEGVEFDCKLAPEHSRNQSFDSLELIFRDNTGWKMQSESIRVMFVDDNKKPALYLDIKDSFTNEVISFVYFLKK